MSHEDKLMAYCCRGSSTTWERWNYITKKMAEEHCSLHDAELHTLFWHIHDIATEIESSYKAGSSDVLDKLAKLKLFADACVDFKCLDKNNVKRCKKKDDDDNDNDKVICF